MLNDHEIEYEVSAATGSAGLKGEATLSVADDDYEFARKLLNKHKKRRTTRDMR